ncbi:hypothetical protein D779_3919 [Imhoffiella purpurea]|uniref:Uncharacterized protein n=1 Tax=Imhoffiella purpurea TaxID=1249627 RepID=W9V8N5_9GAMM|nr:hypothetical protein D779_3919 [Imhoffiella purpurea]
MDSMSRALESLLRAREDVALLPPGTCHLDPLDEEIQRLHEQLDQIKDATHRAGFSLRPAFENPMQR